MFDPPGPQILTEMRLPLSTKKASEASVTGVDLCCAFREKSELKVARLESKDCSVQPWAIHMG